MAALDIPGAFGQQSINLRVPVAMYAESRKSLVSKFMEENSGPAIFLLKGGEQAMRNESDHEPIFRQESFFAHLFGVIESECYATIEVPSGKSTLYVPKLPQCEETICFMICCIHSICIFICPNISNYTIPIPSSRSLF
mmetsp:Transcript_14866/g.19271  ORF Transcript_14866/g.19271 Transcript_14866/m.19271 type:complete len:139 (-) Transcript_14866:34-450(-)